MPFKGTYGVAKAFKTQHLPRNNARVSSGKLSLRERKRRRAPVNTCLGLPLNLPVEKFSRGHQRKWMEWRTCPWDKFPAVFARVNNTNDGCDPVGLVIFLHIKPYTPRCHQCITFPL